MRTGDLEKHHAKTYWLLSAIATIWQERIEGYDDETPFFVVGKERNGQPPYMHSSYVFSVYDVGKWLEDVTPEILGSGARCEARAKRR